MASETGELTSKIIRDLMLGVSGALMLGGTMLFCLQVYNWLQGGPWQEMSFGEFWVDAGFHYPRWHWWNIDVVWSWVFRQPLCAVSFVLGMLILAVRDRPNIHDRHYAHAR